MFSRPALILGIALGLWVTQGTSFAAAVQTDGNSFEVKYPFYEAETCPQGDPFCIPKSVAHPEAKAPKAPEKKPAEPKTEDPFAKARAQKKAEIAGSAGYRKEQAADVGKKPGKKGSVRPGRARPGVDEKLSANGDWEYRFDADAVSADRPSCADTIRLRPMAAKTPLPCFDEYFDVFKNTKASIQDVQEAYVKMLMCRDRCVPEKDARFLARCADWQGFEKIRQIGAKEQEAVESGTAAKEPQATESGPPTGCFRYRCHYGHCFTKSEAERLNYKCDVYDNTPLTAIKNNTASGNATAAESSEPELPDYPDYFDALFTGTPALPVLDCPKDVKRQGLEAGEYTGMRLDPKTGDCREPEKVQTFEIGSFEDFTVLMTNGADEKGQFEVQKKWIMAFVTSVKSQAAKLDPGAKLIIISGDPGSLSRSFTISDPDLILKVRGYIEERMDNPCTDCIHPAEAMRKALGGVLHLEPGENPSETSYKDHGLEWIPNHSFPDAKDRLSREGWTKQALWTSKDANVDQGAVAGYVKSEAESARRRKVVLGERASAKPDKLKIVFDGKTLTKSDYKIEPITFEVTFTFPVDLNERHSVKVIYR